MRFEREKEMPLYYKSIQVRKRRADFLVEDKVIVEIKALVKLEDLHLAQGLNYLQAYNLNVGLLINFGGRHLEFKRLMRKDIANKHPVHPINPAHPGSDYLGKT